MAKKVSISKDSVFIGGVEYIPKTSAGMKTEVNTKGLPYVCIRTHSAGVHFGYLVDKQSTAAGMEVTLLQSQRMRFWKGAMDISVLSTVGSSSPNECKPSVVVPKIHIVAIEIIPVSEQAFENIKSMPIWK